MHKLSAILIPDMTEFKTKNANATVHEKRYFVMVNTSKLCIALTAKPEK